ncbi:poliovirus receptor homolog [Echinops telfairi]|uniref:Poliovirus receptor homolog n=1 Tax=Echinops telfairi TaxID=9371 RepID=A0AC55DA45_ECHTE|nr:poliovirus receptor homolog [Echinops telfairi]
MGQDPQLQLLGLGLLLMAQGPLRAGTQDVSLQSLPEVLGYQGANVTLPCRLLLPQGHGQVTQVQWQLLGDTPTNVAIMLSTGETHFSNPKRMAFHISGTATGLLDGSLVLRELSSKDEGSYTCEFVLFPQGSLKDRVRLRVLAQPQVQALALPVDIPLSPAPVPLALCVTIGGRPPSNVSWSLPWDRNISQKAQTSQGPGPLPGTDNVNSSLMLMPQSWMDGKNVTCRVEHESFKEPRELPVMLNIRSSAPHSHDNLGRSPTQVARSQQWGAKHGCQRKRALLPDAWEVPGKSECSVPCHSRFPGEVTFPLLCLPRTTGPLPPSAVDQGHRLLIRTVDESVNTTFICSVTNTLGTRWAEKTIQVKGKSGEQSTSFNLHWLIISISISISILVILVIAFLLVYKIRCRCMNRNRAAANRGGANGSNADPSLRLNPVSGEAGRREMLADERRERLELPGPSPHSPGKHCLQRQ